MLMCAMFVCGRAWEQGYMFLLKTCCSDCSSQCITPVLCTCAHVCASTTRDDYDDYQTMIVEQKTAAQREECLCKASTNLLAI